MKTILQIVAIFTTAIIITSCDDENTPGPEIPPVVYGNYSQLKAGNYWIYQQFLVDSNSVGTPLQVFDSCFVEKDTVINNLTYFKYNRQDPLTNTEDILFLRDSLSYTVDSEGNIHFSSTDFSTVFSQSYYSVNVNDTVCLIQTQMADPNQLVSVPAGTFNTMNFKQTYFMYPNWTAGGTTRNRHNRYAVNVGKVIETLPFFVSQPTYLERRLVRYHLVP